MNWRKNFFYLLPPVLVLCTVLLVNFKTDLSAFIIAGDNAEEILLANEMQSGALSRRYLLSVGSADTEVKHHFIQKLQYQLNAINGVNDVWVPGQQSKMSQAIQNLYGGYASAFYSLDPAPYLADTFTSQGLEQKAHILKKMLLSPQGSLIKPLALQDPLLLTLNGFQSVAGQMQQLTSANKHYQNLVLETSAAGLDALEQSRIQTSVKQVFDTLNVLGNYQLEMTGVPIFAVATHKLIQDDITKVSIFSSLALMLLFLLIFRSFSVLFQVFSLLAIVILGAILTTQLIFGYVHGMTVAIGSTLIGICIDYPIHAVAHAQSVKSTLRIKIITKIWPSMVLGGITTMIGYVALGISGYPGFQQIAVYAASGILISLLLTRFVFPSLITRESQQPLNVPLVAHWAKFCQDFRPWLIGLLIIAIGGSLFSLGSLHWMQDMQELTPELDYLKKKDKIIRARMTTIEPSRFVMITGDNLEMALQKAEQVYPVLDQLKKTGELSDYFGLYPWLLSAKKQQQNQAILKQYLTAENRQQWQQALKTEGLSVKRLGNLEYPSISALRYQQVLDTPAGKLIDSRVVVGEKQSIVMVWLSDHQPEAVKLAMNQIENAQYFSQRDMLNNMTKSYTQRAQKLLLIGLSVIVLILWGQYKSLFKTLQTLLPAVLAAFLILAVWSVTGEAISFLHLVGFLLVIAICVDYGIFYQENRGGDIALTYQAMAASMLTSALAFGSLMTAESTSLRIMAGVVALGVILGFVLCPLIIRVEKKV